MRIMNTDTVSYHFKTPEKYLETAERKKKRKYLNACLNKCRHFTPFVVSVDGLLGVEAEVTLKRIARRLAQKRKKPYSCNCRYVKSRAAINILRATHRFILRGRVLASRISMTRTQWEDGSGLHLFW